jgi:hypothetical protein
MRKLHLGNHGGGDAPIELMLAHSGVAFGPLYVTGPRTPAGGAELIPVLRTSVCVGLRMDGPPFHVYNNRQTYSSYNSSPNRSPLGQRASAMSFPSNPRTADGSRWQSPHGDKRTGRSRGRSRLRRVAPSRSREDLRMGRAPRRKSAPRRQPPKRRRDDAAPESPHAEGRPEPSESPTFPIVGIGASAGGLEAFSQLLESSLTPAWPSC